MRCRTCGGEIPDGGACPSCRARKAGAADPSEEALTRTGPGRGDLPPGGAGAGVRPGTILAGRYRILDLAGRGGMGEVYRAEDLKLDQAVALKFLPEEMDRDDRALSRLLNEVRSARQVSHPNVCRVHDVGEAEGRHFLSMEYIAGEDLATLLKRKGRLPPDTALAVARQLCAGLAAAHEKGVLHRDLKPSNVMLDERGVARIADFGLAEASAVIPGTKALEGTPLYMSPEQLSGREVTKQSDIYALGLLLYEIFAGRPAYPGGSLDDLLRLRQHPPLPLSSLAPDLDPAVERAVLRCLESDPLRRPSSARAVATALPGGDPLGAALEAAQQRADRIAAFRSELSDLRRAGVLRLADDDLSALERHHEGILRDLVRTYDVDLSERGRHLSLGMRIVSLIGAIAFAASLFYFFYRIWGVISLPVQIGILAAAPAGALLATAILARRERAGYFTSMAGMLALAGLVLDTTVLSNVFNIPFSPWQFLGWGFFALLLAYAFSLRLLLGFGLFALALFQAGLLQRWIGAPWTGCVERWEMFLPAGALALFLPALLPHRAHPRFVPVYRVLGLALLFAPVIFVANGVQFSYLPLGDHPVRVLYQVLGFAAGAAAIGFGIARREKDLAYGGSTAFIALLYSQFASWWWDWMPKYLFFLIVGATAIVIVLILKRLRAALTAAGEAGP